MSALSENAASHRGTPGVGGVRSSARERILGAATREFLEKGFLRASLRSIAAAAQVTTGAIYGYFPSKEALFDAIVSPAGDELYQRFRSLQDRFYGLPPEGQALGRMRAFEEASIGSMCDFMLDNRIAFALICDKAAGTSWERYADRFADFEVESTHRYVGRMVARGVAVKDISPELLRVIVGMLYRGFFEPVRKGMGRQQAHAFLKDYVAFFNAGFVALMAPAPSGPQGA